MPADKPAMLGQAAGDALAIAVKHIAILSRQTRSRKSLRFAFHISAELIICICYLEILKIYYNGKNYLVPYQGNYTPDLVRRPPSCSQTFQAKPCLGVAAC
jgi:hypothetical protein